MNLKRIFRGPLFWILLITVTVLVVVEFAGSAAGSREIRTATMVTYLDDAKVKEVTFVEGDKEIQATLKNGTEVRSKWLGDQGSRLVEQSEKAVAAKKLKTFDVKVPKQNAF